MFAWLAFNTLCCVPLVVLALLARRMRRVPPALEHVLWLLVLVRLVLPPLPGGGGRSEESTSEVISVGPPSLGDEIMAGTTRLLGPNWSTWGTQVLVGLFLTVLALVLIRELRRARAVQRCVTRAWEVSPELRRHVHAVARGLGVAPPRIRVSPEVAGPFLWSVREPVLVLPATEGLPEPTVLAHELAHLLRRDHWSAWLELLVQGFHFWNPLFWLARRQMHRTAELACDHWVVGRFPGDRRRFAQALVVTAERALDGVFVPRAAQAIGEDPRDFEERLVRILHGENERSARRGFLAGGVLCAALTLPGVAVPSLGEFREALPGLPDGIDLEHWRRVLAAADARLQLEPNHGVATMSRGGALLGLGRAREALEAFERQLELGYEPAKSFYNQACAHVLLGDLSEALGCLDEAAALGLDVAGYLAVDEDLAVLRPLYSAR